MAEGQGRSSGQGVKLMLIRDYLFFHTDKNHFVNSKQIVSHLATYGIKADKKTIYNDIFILQGMGIDIYYDRSKHGYNVRNRPFEPYELRLMVDSVQASKFITQERARDITTKIASLSDIYTRDSLNRRAYVSNRVRSMNDSVVKDSDKLHECIATDHKVGFRYFHYSPSKEKQYSKSGTQYIVSPYALLWNDGNYYLFAFDAEKAKFLHFRIDRMERIAVLPEKRDGKDEFKKVDLNSRQTKVFNMFSGKEYTVRLRCINRLADAIIDRFGKDSMLIPDGAEHFIVSVKVETSDQFYAWISSFGRRVKILSPEPVVEEMRKFVERLADMYKEEGKM